MRYWVLSYYGQNFETAVIGGPVAFDEAERIKKDALARKPPDAFGNVNDPYVIVMTGPTSSTPTTATPEELAAKLTDANEIAMFYDPSEAVGLALDAATMIRAQDRQIEAQRAEIERLTADLATADETIEAFRKAEQKQRERARAAEAKGTELQDMLQIAEAALAAVTAERDRMREALTEVMTWIKNWTPSFVWDDEWDATDDKVTAALSAKEAADER